MPILPVASSFLGLLLCKMANNCESSKVGQQSGSLLIKLWLCHKLRLYGFLLDLTVIRIFSWSLPRRVQRSRFYGKRWRVILLSYSSSDNASPTVLNCRLREEKTKMKLDAGWEAELEFQILTYWNSKSVPWHLNVTFFLNNALYSSFIPGGANTNHLCLVGN